MFRSVLIDRMSMNMSLLSALRSLFVTLLTTAVFWVRFFGLVGVFCTPLIAVDMWQSFAMLLLLLQLQLRLLRFAFCQSVRMLCMDYVVVIILCLYDVWHCLLPLFE